MFLREHTQSVTALAQVGKAIAAAYKAMDIQTMADLLELAPRSYEDRSVIVPIGQSQEGQMCNTFIQILAQTTFSSKRILKIIAIDTTSGKKVSLLCFNRDFLSKVLRVGSTYYFYGQVTQNGFETQSSSFDVKPVIEGKTPEGFGHLEPIYPLSGILTQRIIRRDMRNAFSQIGSIDNEVPGYLLYKHRYLDTSHALKALHFPLDQAQANLARRSLAYAELLYMLLVLKRRTARRAPAERREQSELERRLIKSLPFALTSDQEKVIQEIRADLGTGMNRLLQGDVGSGKTLVAWITALNVIENKGQVAFMAPTELLSRQHAQGAAKLMSLLGVKLAYLTGSVSQSQRKSLLAALKDGQIDILIGTHALFSKDVEFKNLSLVIIDEQHRFGVSQRLALQEKGSNADLLMMTATPIPRSLAMTMFADLQISTIHTMPEGRKPIVTYLVSEDHRSKMYDAVGVEFKRGHQAYFVYPRIDEEGQSELRDVTSMHEFLQKQYPGVPSALIHSRLPEDQKAQILEDFTAGKLMYLVSTSVVEVGIDVAKATCMIIEHADRFGLAALHQLRGRVGRSALQSWCFLVFPPNPSEDAVKRLRCLRDSNDGFLIAEQDFMIRGPGDIIGSRQSGFERLRYASLVGDLDIIEEAQKDADHIISTDPGLLDAENAILRNVLTLAPPFKAEILGT